MSKLEIFTVVAIAALATSTTQAALIASLDDSGGGGTHTADLADLDFSLEYESEFYGSDAFITPPRRLGTADIGNSFDMVGPNPGVFISILTNGDDDPLYVNDTSRLESEWFAGDDDLTGPDFVGTNLGRIAIVLNNVNFVSPGSDPNGNGEWTDYTYDVTFNFYSVPEPTTLALLGLGGLLMLPRRGRREVRG